MEKKKDIGHLQKTQDDFAEIDIKLVEAYFNSAVGYLKIGELEFAIKAAMKALEINSNYHPAHVLLETIKQEYLIFGLTCLKENRFNDAIRSFQYAIAIDPTFIETYCELGRVYLRQLDEEESETEEVDAITHISKRITPLVMASKLVSEALQINPTHQQAQNLLADIKKRVEKEAQYDFLDSIGIDHDWYLGKQERSELKHAHVKCMRENGIDNLIEALFLVDVRWGLGYIIPTLVIETRYQYPHILMRIPDWGIFLTVATKIVQEAIRIDSTYQPTQDLLEVIEEKWLEEDSYYNFLNSLAESYYLKVKTSLESGKLKSSIENLFQLSDSIDYSESSEELKVFDTLRYSSDILAQIREWPWQVVVTIGLFLQGKHSQALELYHCFPLNSTENYSLIWESLEIALSTSEYLMAEESYDETEAKRAADEAEYWNSDEGHRKLMEISLGPESAYLEPIETEPDSSPSYEEELHEGYLNELKWEEAEELYGFYPSYGYYEEYDQLDELEEMEHYSQFEPDEMVEIQDIIHEGLEEIEFHSQ
ncbi:MAG: tetratricopeptide repeat protein [Candidatus Poribacteria bacterium]|nr:tetratricopeptide repeat protein [Candidatus Poribacteria bacterium]